MAELSSARRYQATLQGFVVRYVEADPEFARYPLGGNAEQATLLRSFVAPDQVMLDDLFLARRISEASAELLQTVGYQRYKQRRNIVVTGAFNPAKATRLKGCFQTRPRHTTIPTSPGLSNNRFGSWFASLSRSNPIRWASPRSGG